MIFSERLLMKSKNINLELYKRGRIPVITRANNVVLKKASKPLAPLAIPRKNTLIKQYDRVEPGAPCNFEIFAYCSKNYEDAYNFVINSWTRPANVTKVTIYTDWDLKPDNPKVEVINMFEESKSWIIGTGRRLDVIKHFSDRNKGQTKNILFLDIDCFIVGDVSEVFNRPFDIAITRLFCGEDYANKTATAGLWFAKLSSGYYNFIEDWFKRAELLKTRKVGIEDHRISYVQYSFTDVARTKTPRYNVLPIDEKIYNSEHSDEKLWYKLIRKFHPKILHYKGRRFRDSKIIAMSLSLAGAKK